MDNPIRRHRISWTVETTYEVEMTGTADEANDLADAITHLTDPIKINDELIRVGAYVTDGERRITKSAISAVKEPEFEDGAPLNAWDSYTYGN